MDSQSNFNGGNDTMSKTTMQETISHFGGSILPRMCMTSSSSTSSANSQQTDSGISSASSQSSSSQTTTLSKYECVQHCSFPNCDDVDKYESIAKIGHGTYGEVFKARQPTTNRFVALKRILGDSGKPGVSINVFTFALDISYDVIAAIL